MRSTPQYIAYSLVGNMELSSFHLILYSVQYDLFYYSYPRANTLSLQTINHYHDSFVLVIQLLCEGCFVSGTQNVQ